MHNGALRLIFFFFVGMQSIASHIFRDDHYLIKEEQTQSL
jgi:hypothetical protein